MISGRHVFVVHGTIGKLTVDAQIISTDEYFWIEDHWREALGIREGEELDVSRFKPDDWSMGWGRSRDGRNTWFVDVTSNQTEGLSRFDRLKAALEDIGRCASDAKNFKHSIVGRPVPLIAVPVIGVKGGGFNADRGGSIAALVDVCNSFESEQLIDVAIVTPESSTYGALQQHRRDHFDEIFHTIDKSEARRLGDLARQGSLALLIGAGISMPSGTPSWSSLLGSLVGDHLDEDAKKKFIELSYLDQAQLLADELGGEDALAEAVQSQIDGKLPALGHALLTGLNCREAVTTNYDDLYEQAFAAADLRVAKLPQESARSSDRWILKLHGDLEHPKSIVLTRHQFVTFTSLSEPAGAILQSLLLTRHLLVAGASMNDDNVLRLIHEVVEYRDKHGVEQASSERTTANKADTRTALGTVLDVSAEPLREKLHEQHFIWSTMNGAELADRTRSLEIFLDAIGVHAGTNQWWMLDPRFASLHPGPRHALVEEAAHLYESIIESDLAGPESAWTPLAEALKAIGADQSGKGSEQRSVGSH